MLSISIVALAIASFAIVVLVEECWHCDSECIDINKHGAVEIMVTSQMDAACTYLNARVTTKT
jgi:hypothetical protein